MRIDYAAGINPTAAWAAYGARHWKAIQTSDGAGTVKREVDYAAVAGKELAFLRRRDDREPVHNAKVGWIHSGVARRAVFHRLIELNNAAIWIVNGVAEEVIAFQIGIGFATPLPVIGPAVAARVPNAGVTKGYDRARHRAVSHAPGGIHFVKIERPRADWHAATEASRHSRGRVSPGVGRLGHDGADGDEGKARENDAPGNIPERSRPHDGIGFRKTSGTKATKFVK